MAGKKRLSEMLVKQQIILMGKLAFRSDSDVVRCSIFNPYTCELRRLPGPAKRGRPRIRWPVYVLDKRVGIVGSLEQFLNYWHRDNGSFVVWKVFVRESSF